MRKKGKNAERKEEGKYNTTVDCTVQQQIVQHNRRLYSTTADFTTQP
jgi:hypothetical protein